MDTRYMDNLKKSMNSEHPALCRCYFCCVVREGVIEKLPDNELDMLDFYFYWSDGTWRKEN